MQHQAVSSDGDAAPGDYRIGAEDLLNITVYGAPDLDRTVRVSSEGRIYLPLVGDVQASGRTPRELEAALEEVL
ncbi:MAG: polysaccharide biosynthesis/export family protein, partial [Candidatus Acidiferrales bacterium]